MDQGDAPLDMDSSFFEGDWLLDWGDGDISNIADHSLPPHVARTFQEVTDATVATDFDEGFGFATPATTGYNVAGSLPSRKNGELFPTPDDSSALSTNLEIILLQNTLGISIGTARATTAPELVPNDGVVHAVIKRTRPRKPRLPCTYPSCKSTFPRRYELQRHEKNIHHHTFNVSCPVYGCKRTSKPFGRLDKLSEHLRKHRSLDNVLCLIEGCTTGPFTLPSLADRLASHHLHEHSQAPNLYQVMEILSPDVLGGEVLFEVAEKYQEGRGRCPLVSLGCSFQLSIANPQMGRHMGKHELIDISRHYDAVKLSCGKYWSFQFWWGSATCPICQSRQFWSVDTICWHLYDDHSQEERRICDVEISQMFEPIFANKEEILPWYSRRLHLLRDELHGTAK